MPSRSPGAGRPIPRVFILGVAMNVAWVGLFLLQSVTAGSGSAGAVEPSSGPTGTIAGSPSSSSTLGTPAPSDTQNPATPRPVPHLTGYAWPIPNARVTLPFGPSSWGEFIVDGQRFHDGVDMATQCGDNVLAAHDGVVLAASREYDVYMGWTSDITPYYHLLDTKHWWSSLPIVIVINDGNGYRSIYAHESKVMVKPGQHVKAGQVIGMEGATGNATGCHVHYGLFNPNEDATFALDPAVVAKDLMPAYETARVDPLLILPFRCEIEEMRTLRPAEATACPPLPSTSPSIGPSAKPSSSARPKSSPSLKAGG